MTARVPVELPTLGFEMATGRLVGWLKEIGESVARNEPLAEIETEKTTVELESPRRGVLVERCVEAGAEVAVGTVIAYLEAE